MYSENNLVMISALQHYLFCKRQCAFIHLEQAWQENIFTAKGRLMHERVDQTRRESRRDVRVEYGVPLRSLRLGLVGKADVIEFHFEEGNGMVWRPYPVEFKLGAKKKENWDTVQLCAQALCLEEMLEIEVPKGAIFYGRNRRRQDVHFDERLRLQTKETAAGLHRLIETEITPRPIYEKKCLSCSFYSACLPKTVTRMKKVERYFKQVFEEP